MTLRGMQAQPQDLTAMIDPVSHRLLTAEARAIMGLLELGIIPNESGAQGITFRPTDSRGYRGITTWKTKELKGEIQQLDDGDVIVSWEGGKLSASLRQRPGFHSLTKLLEATAPAVTFSLLPEGLPLMWCGHVGAGYAISREEDRILTLMFEGNRPLVAGRGGIRFPVDRKVERLLTVIRPGAEEDDSNLHSSN